MSLISAAIALFVARLIKICVRVYKKLYLSINGPVIILVTFIELNYFVNDDERVMFTAANVNENFATTRARVP